MSELRLETLTVPAAALGAANPLAPLAGAGDLHAQPDTASLPPEIASGAAYGRVQTILPYTLQDGYGRERASRRLAVAVLENDLLRATFLLDFGGRLWSLVDKRDGRELLYRNSVLQPANLALRNAWFSGGVEWNIGTIGHSPLTCAPLFAARLEGPDGEPVLRLWEFERLREVVFQLDFRLPVGSPVLLVAVSICNPHARAVPMYWWSNIAVPEMADGRVLVPAERAHWLTYDGRLRALPVPAFDGVDRTYPERTRPAADFFFVLPDMERPWIASVDAGGAGLVQASTARLRGRKLFVWGTAPGGRRWQDWLSEPGRPYLEIQAGLARTQLEHVPMPARTDWSWVEAYGPLALDPAAAHGDWTHARASVEAALDGLLGPSGLDGAVAAAAQSADRQPAEVLHHGAGWGVLEQQRRRLADAQPLTGPGTPWPVEALGEAEQPWLDLLRTGRYPAGEPARPPAAGPVSEPWSVLLEHSLRHDENGWEGWLQLGVMRAHAGDDEGAVVAWERSLAAARTPWALRNLALVDAAAGRHAAAADRLVEAQALAPSVRALALEAGEALLGAGLAGACVELVERLAASLRAHGRVRLLEARAALAAGDRERVRSILGDENLVVVDLREGETTLDQLWFAVHDAPLPARLDFRMREPTDAATLAGQGR